VLGYYSQAELRELVAHAASRSVTVVPEIEFTNHLTAALHAYPDLMCANNPVRLGQHPWGQDRDTTQWMEPCVGREEPFQCLEGILSEVTEIFPSPYVHVGGDEYFGVAWAQCPDCQRRLQEETLEAEETSELRELFSQCRGAKNKYLLYRYTMRRICGLVTARGRIPVLWDDLAWRGKFPPQAVIMQWHAKGGRDPWQHVNAPENPAVPAVQAGHDAIVVQHDYLYLHGGDLTKLYNFEPIPQEISADQQAHILGPEGALWETPQPRVDGFVFPQLCALAEIAWSPRELRSLADFNGRMRDHEARLNKLGVACCQKTPEKPAQS
jgi:hexosaminidase